MSDGALLPTYDEETTQGVPTIAVASDGEVFAYGRGDATVATALVPCFFGPCDANCDGSVNASDIEPFIELLFGGGTPCAICTGDTNGDGTIDSFDIEGFITCLFP